MNIAKNMESIFIAALCVASMSSLAHAAVPSHHSAAPVMAQADSAKMQVVTITAKRLSVAQKAQLGA
jgi:hypothetical protein